MPPRELPVPLRRGEVEEELRRLVERLEQVHGMELPESIVDALVDWEQDLLFVRFKEPSGPEVGEPLPTRAPAFLFTDERTGEVTALEVIGLSELLKEGAGEAVKKRFISQR
jgi:hypothetical protein